MLQITLTSEQAAVLSGASGTVLLLDPSGKAVGQAAPQCAPSKFSPEQLEESRRILRSEVNGITTPELLARLNRLRSQ